MTNIAIVSAVTPFDAGKGTTINFIWDGDQAYKNRLVVTNVDTNEEVFNEVTETFKLSHVLPPNTQASASKIVNSAKYIAQISIFDSSGKETQLSNPQYFYCIKTPEFYFRNIKNEQVVENSSITAQLYYAQTDNEMIKDYKFYLYKADNSTVSESSILYSGDLSYSYKGLEDHATYYIRATGNTVHGMLLDTGKIKVTILYVEPESYSRLEVKCDPIRGFIRWNTNIVSISCNGTDIYNYPNGTAIDLTEHNLVYNEGFKIDDDFTMIISAYKLNHEGTVIECSNGLYSFKIVSIYYGTMGTQRFKLEASNGLGKYILYSAPYDDIQDNDMFKIWIRREHNIYQMHIILNPSVEMTFDHLNYGTRPEYFPEDETVYIYDDSEENEIVDVDNMKVYYGDEPDITNCNNNDLWLSEEGEIHD